MATNPPPPPPPSGGPGEFLKTQIGPFPLWLWLVAGAGVAAFFIVPKILGSRTSSSGTTSATGTTNGTSQASTQAANQAALASEGIDPLTGVPFAVESAINPNTGLPNYYNASIPGWYTPVTNQPQSPGSPPPNPPTQPTGTGPLLLNPTDPNSLYLGYPTVNPYIPTPATAPTYRYGGF